MSDVLTSQGASQHVGITGKDCDVIINKTQQENSRSQDVVAILDEPSFTTNSPTHNLEQQYIQLQQHQQHQQQHKSIIIPITTTDKKYFPWSTLPPLSAAEQRVASDPARCKEYVDKIFADHTRRFLHELLEQALLSSSQSQQSDNTEGGSNNGCQFDLYRLSLPNTNPRVLPIDSRFMVRSVEEQHVALYGKHVPYVVTNATTSPQVTQQSTASSTNVNTTSSGAPVSNHDGPKLKRNHNNTNDNNKNLDLSSSTQQTSNLPQTGTGQASLAALRPKHPVQRNASTRSLLRTALATNNSEIVAMLLAVYLSAAPPHGVPQLIDTSVVLDLQFHGAKFIDIINPIIAYQQTQQQGLGNNNGKNNNNNNNNGKKILKQKTTHKDNLPTPHVTSQHNNPNNLIFGNNATYLYNGTVSPAEVKKISLYDVAFRIASTCDIITLPTSPVNNTPEALLQQQQNAREAAALAHAQHQAYLLKQQQEREREQNQINADMMNKTVHVEFDDAADDEQDPNRVISTTISTIGGASSSLPQILLDKSTYTDLQQQQQQYHQQYPQFIFFPHSYEAETDEFYSTLRNTLSNYYSTPKEKDIFFHQLFRQYFVQYGHLPFPPGQFAPLPLFKEDAVTVSNLHAENNKSCPYHIPPTHHNQISSSQFYHINPYYYNHYLPMYPTITNLFLPLIVHTDNVLNSFSFFNDLVNPYAPMKSLHELAWVYSRWDLVFDTCRKAKIPRNQILPRPSAFDHGYGAYQRFFESVKINQHLFTKIPEVLWGHFLLLQNKGEIITPPGSTSKLMACESPPIIEQPNSALLSGDNHLISKTNNNNNNNLNGSNNLNNNPENSTTRHTATTTNNNMVREDSRSIAPSHINSTTLVSAGGGVVTNNNNNTNTSGNNATAATTTTGLDKSILNNLNNNRLKTIQLITTIIYKYTNNVPYRSLTLYTQVMRQMDYAVWFYPVWAKHIQMCHIIQRTYLRSLYQQQQFNISISKQHRQYLKQLQQQQELNIINNNNNNNNNDMSIVNNNNNNIDLTGHFLKTSPILQNLVRCGAHSTHSSISSPSSHGSSSSGTNSSGSSSNNSGNSGSSNSNSGSSSSHYPLYPSYAPVPAPFRLPISFIAQWFGDLMRTKTLQQKLKPWEIIDQILVDDELSGTTKTRAPLFSKQYCQALNAIGMLTGGKNMGGTIGNNTNQLIEKNKDIVNLITYQYLIQAIGESLVNTANCPCILAHTILTVPHAHKFIPLVPMFIKKPKDYNANEKNNSNSNEKNNNYNSNEKNNNSNNNYISIYTLPNIQYIQPQSFHPVLSVKLTKHLSEQVAGCLPRGDRFCEFLQSSLQWGGLIEITVPVKQPGFSNYPPSSGKSITPPSTDSRSNPKSNSGNSVGSGSGSHTSKSSEYYGYGYPHGLFSGGVTAGLAAMYEYHQSGQAIINLASSPRVAGLERILLHQLFPVPLMPGMDYYGLLLGGENNTTTNNTNGNKTNPNTPNKSSINNNNTSSTTTRTPTNNNTTIAIGGNSNNNNGGGSLGVDKFNLNNIDMNNNNNNDGKDKNNINNINLNNNNNINKNEVTIIISEDSTLSTTTSPTHQHGGGNINNNNGINNLDMNINNNDNINSTNTNPTATIITSTSTVTESTMQQQQPSTPSSNASTNRVTFNYNNNSTVFGFLNNNNQQQQTNTNNNNNINTSQQQPFSNLTSTPSKLESTNNNDDDGDIANNNQTNNTNINPTTTTTTTLVNKPSPIKKHSILSRSFIGRSNDNNTNNNNNNKDTNNIQQQQRNITDALTIQHSYGAGPLTAFLHHLQPSTAVLVAFMVDLICQKYYLEYECDAPSYITWSIQDELRHATTHGPQRLLCNAIIQHVAPPQGITMAGGLLYLPICVNPRIGAALALFFSKELLQCYIKAQTHWAAVFVLMYIELIQPYCYVGPGKAGEGTHAFIMKHNKENNLNNNNSLNTNNNNNGKNNKKDKDNNMTDVTQIQNIVEACDKYLAEAETRALLAQAEREKQQNNQDKVKDNKKNKNNNNNGQSKGSFFSSLLGCFGGGGKKGYDGDDPAANNPPIARRASRSGNNTNNNDGDYEKSNINNNNNDNTGNNNNGNGEEGDDLISELPNTNNNNNNNNDTNQPTSNNNNNNNNNIRRNEPLIEVFPQPYHYHDLDYLVPNHIIKLLRPRGVIMSKENYKLPPIMKELATFSKHRRSLAEFKPSEVLNDCPLFKRAIKGKFEDKGLSTDILWEIYNLVIKLEK